MRNKWVVIVMALGAIGIVLAYFTTALAEGKKPASVQVSVAVQGFDCAACTDGLAQDLGKVDGISEVKATLKPPMVTAKIDEHKINVSEFVAKIAAHPQMMDPKKTYGAQLVLCVDTAMCAKEKKMCPACFTELPKAFKTVKEISTVSLDDTGKVATIGFAPGAKVTTAQITKALAMHSFKFIANFACPASMQQADQSKAATCPMGDDAGCAECGK